MKSFYQLIKERRTCRRFQHKMVARELKEQLIEAVRLAPTSKNSRPWQFVIVENKSTLEVLSFSKPTGSKVIKYAPLAIVVLANPDKSDVWIEDTSIAAIYLQLAAEDLGLGSCWVQIRHRSHESGIRAEEYVKRTLDIPDELEVEAIIAIGYKDKESEPYREDELPTVILHQERYL